MMPLPEFADALIRAKLASGALPRVTRGGMYAGYGRGKLCDGCGHAITPLQVEWEFQSADGAAIRFHLVCASVWEAERQRLARR